MMPLMTVKDFQYFLAIVKEKSITKAAKKLFIAQPSLSQYVKRIEEEIGSPLFYRLPTGIKLTDVGYKYYNLARKVLQNIDDFTFDIQEVSGLKSGTIKFGITPNLSICLLPYIIPPFKKIYPDLKINLSEIVSSQQEKQLIDGDLNFSLMHLHSKNRQNEQLSYNVISRDPFMAVIPTSFTKLFSKIYLQNGILFCNIEDLKDFPIITVTKNQLIYEITMKIFKKAKIYSPNIIMENLSPSTVFRLASAGMGVALLPRHDIFRSITPTQVIICHIPNRYEAHWNLCYATLKNPYLTKADQLFLQAVKDSIKKYDEEIQTREILSLNTAMELIKNYKFQKLDFSKKV